MGVALPTLVVLVLLGCGFRSVEAVSYTKHSSCNVECGQKGLWNMDQFGATAKEGKCYYCWFTGFGYGCPYGTSLKEPRERKSGLDGSRNKPFFQGADVPREARGLKDRVRQIFVRARVAKGQAYHCLELLFND